MSDPKAKKRATSAVAKFRAKKAASPLTGEPIEGDSTALAQRYRKRLDSDFMPLVQAFNHASEMERIVHRDQYDKDGSHRHADVALPHGTPEDDAVHDAELRMRIAAAQLQPMADSVEAEKAAMSSGVRVGSPRPAAPQPTPHNPGTPADATATLAKFRKATRK